MSSLDRCPHIQGCPYRGFHCSYSLLSKYKSFLTWWWQWKWLQSNNSCNYCWCYSFHYGEKPVEENSSCFSFVYACVWSRVQCSQVCLLPNCQCLWDCGTSWALCTSVSVLSLSRKLRWCFEKLCTCFLYIQWTVKIQQLNVYSTQEQFVMSYKSKT